MSEMHGVQDTGWGDGLNGETFSSWRQSQYNTSVSPMGATSETGVDSERDDSEMRGNFMIQAAFLSNRRRRSERKFQSGLANERSFRFAFRGEELEEPYQHHPELTQPKIDVPQAFLLRLKINTFAVPLGLSSQALMWGMFSSSSLVTLALGTGNNIPDTVQWVLWMLALALLVAVGIGYVLKAFFFWGAVRREWAHPVRSNFFFAPLLASITIVLGVPENIAKVIHPMTKAPMPAYILLASLVFVMEMTVYGRWLFNQTSSLRKANPSYQLAVVGNFLLATLGTRVSGSPIFEIICREISKFFFAVGSLYLLLVFFAIQSHSADNVDHPSTAIADPSRAVGHDGKRNAVKERRASKAGSSVRGSPQDHPQQQLHHEMENGDGNARHYLEDAPEGDDDVPATDVEALALEEQVAVESIEGTHAGDVSVGESNVDGRFSSPWVAPEHENHHHHASPAPLSPPAAHSPIFYPVPFTSRSPRGVSSHKTKQDLKRISKGSTRPPPCDHQGEVKLSRALHPIYFLFVAPPSAAAIAWTRISGDFDTLARSFYFVAGFLYMFFVLGNWKFLKTNCFTLAWWAYSFPSSTFASASILYAEDLVSESMVLAAFGLGLASTCLVFVIFVATIRAALKGTLFGYDPVVCVRLEKHWG